MTSAAKNALSTTVRGLRERLLKDLHNAVETTSRLSVRARDAGLDEVARVRRERLEAWIAEQLRTQANGGRRGKSNRTEADFRLEAEKQAAYTLLNRLVILRLIEEGGSSDSRVLQGGWESGGYGIFRHLAPDVVRGDDTEGYAFLLGLLFEELAQELPGLYGPVGVADLIPIPPSTLRHVVEALNQPELESCWADDMTLGWVYQYWNDPEREKLDEKLNARGKLEPHEVASKTQMFTERYMVDWLLQNSLGPMWLAMCRKHGWTPEVEADGTLDRLEERRAEWRRMRDAGEVALTDLMPLHTDAERRWAYYVSQPIPGDAVEHAADTVRDLRILDPAVGSGHFLVVALDLLLALYREEARHRGEAHKAEWSDRAIVERILSHNLHGIDLDPRAVQIAAAALWLKARQIAPDAHPENLNLVASDLRLGSLPDDDPALVELRREVEREAGIPPALTDTVLHALRGADHLGSLLKVDHAVDEAIEAQERAAGIRFGVHQPDLFGRPAAPQGAMDFDSVSARRSVLERLEGFLSRHTRGDDLGLRLRGEQLAAGVRFLRMVREGHYDLVVANPPYQGTSKMADAGYVEAHYLLGKADLYAAFLLRGLQLVRRGGLSSMLTMRNWMFIKQFSGLREHILSTYDVRALGDFAVGAFDEVPNDVLSVVVSILRRAAPTEEPSVAQQPTSPYDASYDRGRTDRKRAATLVGEGFHTFLVNSLKPVPGWPIVHWWDEQFLAAYLCAPLLEDLAPVAVGASTGDNARFLRFAFETPVSQPPTEAAGLGACGVPWVPFINGAKGRVWIEDLREHMAWHRAGLAYRVFCGDSSGANFRSPHLQFRLGVAFSMIGAGFTARLHRFPSIFGNKGSSVFPEDRAAAVCTMNCSRARLVLGSLNPGIGFEVGDVNRLPLFHIDGAQEIVAVIEHAFDVHESHREPSVEFVRPGPSSWLHAQAWAQEAVDRPTGEPLPPYNAEPDPEPATDHLSFALGVALGRFGPAGEGILNPSENALPHALPGGILFLDGTLPESDHRDGLGHPAAQPLHEAWAQYGPGTETRRAGLREWLSLDFFKDVHRTMYENRPIHWPLSSANRTFVAWVNIHRMNEGTLRVLRADHLLPTRTRLEGELNDLRAARDGSDRRAARVAEREYDRLTRALFELQEFISAVEQCGDRGPPPTDPKCPPREQDARFDPDLDDGVMINSAALWPLLDPQWKDPKKWWKELATAKGKKDYDWSRLAMWYWPSRVDGKCHDDPSLAVAHGCFWRYHPARAWSWELRLQDEIAPDFKIEEVPYRPGGRDVGDAGDGVHRSRWLGDHAAEALHGVEAEAARRMGRGKKRKLVAEMTILEPGLWSVLPEAVWDMELRLSERQGAEFRLLSPDELEARAAFEAAHPDRVREREALLAGLVPPADLLDEVDEDEELESEEDLDAEPELDEGDDS